MKWAMIKFSIIFYLFFFASIYAQDNNQYIKYVKANIGGSVPSNYLTTGIVDIKAGYFITPHFALEARLSKFLNKTNNSYETLTQVNNVIPFIRKRNFLFDLGTNWVPISAKAHFYSKEVILDFYLSAYMGLANISTNRASFAAAPQVDTYDKVYKMNAILGIGTNIYFSKRLRLSIDFEASNYIDKKAKSVKKEIITDMNVLTGIGFFF